MAFNYFAPTESFIFTERTKLTAAAAANAGSVTVENNQGFVVNDYVMIGWLGQGITELRKLGTQSGSTSLVLASNTTFAHKKYVPALKMLYNQRKLYGATSATGIYTLVTGQTVEIEVDDPHGTYVTDTGSTYTHYKVTYINSTTTVETALADAPVIQAETTEDQVLDLLRYCTLEDIRRQSGFSNNPNISDFVIDQKRRRAESEVNGYVRTVYSLPLTAIPALVTTITSLLASGYLLIDEYGPESRDTDKDGYKKVSEARSLLKQIREKELYLTDAAGAVMGYASSGRLQFAPDDSTEEEPIFEISSQDQPF